MKRSIYILTLLLGVFIHSSCDSFLNMQPTNSANAGDVVTSVEEAQEIVNGIMRNMSSSSYYGRRMLLYADAKGGDLTVHSAGRGEDALYIFSHSPTTGAYATFWETGYKLIAQVNYLLENMEQLEADGAEGFELIKGQALTLRALFHFDLVRLYGLPYNMDKSSYGIPVVTKMLSYDSKLTRNTVEETYKQVISDLTEGLDFLDSSKNNRLPGYIDYQTNLAIQARVRLYMEDYEGAFEAAESIIKSGLYTLYEPKEWVNSWTQQNYHESIFEIKMYPNEGDLGTSSLGYYYMRRNHPKPEPEGGTYEASGYFMASDYFLERLNEDPDDVRWGIMARDETSADRLGCCYKYMGSTECAGDGKTPNSAVNIKVFRLSEIYLIAAEAALNKPDRDPALAATYLNQIRRRSPNLPEATAATITDDMILYERSKELYGEGHRFFDLIRKNRTIRFNDDFGGVPSQGRPEIIDRTYEKIVLPISQDEINTNPAIGEQQNPGYL